MREAIRLRHGSRSTEKSYFGWIRTVQELLGHTDVSTTMLYTPAGPRRTPRTPVRGNEKFGGREGGIEVRHFVWVPFDLGVNGDYEGMYRWLDRHRAKECADSVACFWYDHPGDLLVDIKREVSEEVELNNKSRIYVIRLVEGKMRGSFIHGRRRNAPWAGFAETGEEADDTNA